MRALLAKAKYVTLAMARGDEPYLVTLSHGYDVKENCLFFHCAGEGKKMEFWRSNPVVWGQTVRDDGYVQGSCDHLFASVMFRGRVSFPKEFKTKRRALEIMIHQLEEDPTEVLTTQMERRSIERVTIGRVDIDFMSGKRAKKVLVSK